MRSEDRKRCSERSLDVDFGASCRGQEASGNQYPFAAAAPDQPMQFPLLISILLLPHSETGVKAIGEIPCSKTPGLTSREMVSDS